MDKLEALIRQELSGNKSPEEIAQSISTILNKIEQENETIEAREEYIDILETTIADHLAHGTYCVEDAANLAILVTLKEHPTLDDVDIEAIRHAFSTTLRYAIGTIAHPFTQAIKEMLFEREQELEAETEKNKSEKKDSCSCGSGACSCSKDNGTSSWVSSHLKEKDSAIIQSFLDTIK